MPSAVCDRCGHVFVIDSERPPLPRCRDCGEPLRLISPEEARTRLHELQEHAPPQPAELPDEQADALRRQSPELRDQSKALSR